jgi:hypothetical protein
MHINRLALPVLFTTIAGCGGQHDATTPAPQPRLLGTIPITGVGANTNFGFDIGTVVGNRYYVTDRNNAAVDAFDTTANTQIAQIKGAAPNAFAGVGTTAGKVDNAISGPNGVNAVGDLLYVGDVNSVKIVDPKAGTVVKQLAVGTSGKRADEGCVDAAHGIFMISTPEAPVPFATFINTVTQQVVAQVTFSDAQNAPVAGLEACVYDPGSDTFYINVDGTTTNPHGELTAMPGASIRAIPTGASANYLSLAGVRNYAEGLCDPTGLALGPGADIAVGCREAVTGAPLLLQILDRTNGKLQASLNAGGGDQLEYDPQSNRYYNAASRWTASGMASTDGACSLASPCTPVLSIIDAATRKVVTMLPSGNNAHSVAVDAVTGKAFMPTSSATAPVGCATCASNAAFTNAGLLVYAIR